MSIRVFQGVVLTAVLVAGCATPHTAPTATGVPDAAGIGPTTERYRVHAADSAPVAVESVAASSSSIRDDRWWHTRYAIDGNSHSAWIPDPDDAVPTLTLQLGRVVEISGIGIKMESGPIGFDVAVWEQGAWRTIASGLDPAHQRMDFLELPPTVTDRVRLTFTGVGSPVGWRGEGDDRVPIGAEARVCEVKLFERAEGGTPTPAPSGTPGAGTPQERFGCPELGVEAPLDERARRSFVTYNGNREEHLVVYVKNNQAWGRRVGQDGAAEGVPFLIASDKVSEVRAVAGPDGYMVVYDESIETIKAQRVSATGELIGAPVVVATGGVISPRVTFSGREFLVAYNARPAAGAQQAIMGRFLTAEGSLSGAQFVIAENEYVGDVAYSDVTNEFFATGNDIFVGGSAAQLVRGHRVNPLGQVVAGDLPLSDVGRRDSNDLMVYSAVMNQYLVVLNRAPGVAGQNAILYQRVTATGERLGDAITVVGPSQDLVFATGLAHSVRSSVNLIAWMRMRPDPTGQTTQSRSWVEGRLIGPEGEYFCEPFDVSGPDQGEPDAEPSVALGHTGGFYATYGGDGELKGRVIELPDHYME